ncbi:cytochrome P450 [Phaeosphaeria sp. MPI-PUGE-AT-0046c]|nr:cytochrome P450 [Phaeosphaeria sp. MPI-PUGE-AT-0046c]
MNVSNFTTSKSYEEQLHIVSHYVAQVRFVHVLSLLLFALIADYAWMLYMRWKMPPGPFPWPICGNTFSLPNDKPWYYFEQLSKDFNSPLITFWLGRRPTIWINDAWAANEILIKRAGIYSSRPRMLMFAEFGVGQANLLHKQTYTKEQRERFRDLRKITHHGVGIQQVQGYRSFQDDENKAVVYDLLTSPDDYVAHFERYAASVVSIIGFGRRIASVTDPIVTEVIAFMQLAAHVAVIAKDFPRLMESFPFLAKFPNWMAPWKGQFGKNSSKSRSHSHGHERHGFFYALAQEANECEEENYCKYVFREAPKYNLSPAEISSLAANLIGAGADTSSSTLVTAVMAMRAFPETLPAALEELDHVVGKDRSPGPGDDLPYMRAFVKEVFRWRSVAIVGGTAHAPTQDDMWNGYLIPKGTWIQGNVWAIHHNEREFPDPDRFNPSRFLDGEDKRPFPGEKGYMTFGWGRRSCAGQALAEQGTFLSVCRLVWAYRVGPAVDERGENVPVDIFAYTSGSNWRPEPFKVKFTPRDETIRRTIEREGKQALEDLSKYERETKYRFSTFGK